MNQNVLLYRIICSSQRSTLLRVSIIPKHIHNEESCGLTLAHTGHKTDLSIILIPVINTPRCWMNLRSILSKTFLLR
jgi:hypothetical protein